MTSVHQKMERRRGVPQPIISTLTKNGHIVYLKVSCLYSLISNICWPWLIASWELNKSVA